MIVNSYESLNHRHSKISPRQTLERKKHDGFLELRMKRKRVCLCGKEAASRRKHFSCTWKISLGMEASPEVEYSVHVTSLNTETIQVFWMQLCVWAFPASCKCSISSERRKEITAVWWDWGWVSIKIWKTKGHEGQDDIHQQTHPGSDVTWPVNKVPLQKRHS